jgi:holo-[acyl-carrier protein] synthase
MTGGASPSRPRGLRVGIDLVQVSRIADSLERFGQRFTERLFTSAELAYAASAPELTCERLAARFAAKEAAKKALGLTDGIAWRHIEVARTPSGACELVLHGPAADHAGPCTLAVSLSHEGDYATAVVVAERAPTNPETRDPSPVG